MRKVTKTRGRHKSVYVLRIRLASNRFSLSWLDSVANCSWTRIFWLCSLCFRCCTDSLGTVEGILPNNSMNSRSCWGVAVPLEIRFHNLAYKRRRSLPLRFLPDLPSILPAVSVRLLQPCFITGWLLMLEYECLLDVLIAKAISFSRAAPRFVWDGATIWLAGRRQQSRHVALRHDTEPR